MRRLRIRDLGHVIPNLARAARRAGTFIEFGVVQVTVQILGIVTGIVVVRLLPAPQYALYTIANSMLSAMFLLADGGVSTAAAGIGGRAGRDRDRLGQTISTALKVIGWLRNLVSVPIAVVLIWLLARNGATPIEVTIISPLVLAGAAIALHNEIYTVVARLKGNTRVLQAVSFGTAGLRLVSTVLFSAAGLIVETAMLSVVISYAAQWWAMRRWTRSNLDLGARTAAAVQTELKSVVARRLPGALHYVLQAQIGVWLLSIFGSAGTVADLGALNRISVIFVVLLNTMNNVVVPHYTRCQDPTQLGKLYLQIMMGFAGMAAIPVTLVWLAPQPILWVLGDQYMHLPTELVLAVLSASLGSLTGLSWALNANRAWFVPPWISIPIGLLVQLSAMLVIGVSTVRAVLLVAIFTSVTDLVVNVAMTAVCTRRFRAGIRS